MPHSPGTRVGPYELIEIIGTGGMGEVYRAYDPRLRRDVALKLVSTALAGDAAAVDRFLREALAVSALNHPNVVTIHETGDAPGGRFIAMELVQGRSLRELIREGLSPDRASDIGRQLAEALAAAHAAHIVHRDLKPENVMVRADGYVKVLDFGLARVQTHPGSDLATVSFATGAGLVLGTIGYMSPEQARGEAVTTASDVFALGIVLYETFTGQHPFPAATPVAVLHGILSDVPLAPHRLAGGIPPAADQLILECLNKDARLRPSAAEAAARLRASGTAAPATAAAAPAAAGDRTIVGRECELDALRQAFDEAAQGTGSLIALAGEAGLGKTALVDRFLDTLDTPAAPARVARGRCSERLAGSEAYLPVLEALESLLRSEHHGSIARLLKTVAPNWYVQVVSDAQHDSGALREAAAAGIGSPQRMKREMGAFLEEVGRQLPLVLFLDDVHWADGATMDLLAYVAPRLSSMRVLIVATHRPSELAHGRHPFLALKLDLQARRICRELAIESLTAGAVASYVALAFPDHALPPAFVSLVHQKTEGHALFMVDLLRDLQRRGLIVREGGRWVLDQGLPDIERELPESVRSMIQRKIEALGDEDRQLLAAASVQGVDFDSAIVAQALGAPEDVVEDRLERLERQHAFVRFVDESANPDRSLSSRYRFAHVLYQNALFSSLRATRRGSLAGAIAAALVRRWSDRAAEIAPQLAVLFETARAPIAAARYFSLAAQSASRLFAHEEALQLASRGLALLEMQPADAQRRRIELELQMTSALAVKTLKGYAAPDVGAAYHRARELCHEVDDPALVLPVLMGLSAHYVAAGEIRITRELADQLLEVAERIENPDVMMLAEWSLGAARHHLGELPQAHRHFERALALYDPAVHRARAWEVGIEPGIFCRCELSRSLWLLGFPDRALAELTDAERQARTLGHPQTLAFTLLFKALVHMMRREPAPTRDEYARLETLCREKSIAQELMWGSVVHGWAAFHLGDREEGLRLIDAGLRLQADHHSALLRPWYLLLQGEALREAGRMDEARAAVREAAESAEVTAQHMFDAEQRRLEGELALVDGDEQQARRAFEEAIAIARSQEARSLQLRAATSLAKLLEAQGQPAAAHAVLAPIHAWFTEGLDTPDLKNAAGLLAVLAGGRASIQ
jgi:predicted ATPase